MMQSLNASAQLQVDMLSKTLQKEWKSVCKDFPDHVRYSSVSYFRPRPWRNEYDRGSTAEGFTWIIHPMDGRHGIDVVQSVIKRHPLAYDPDAYGLVYLAKMRGAQQ